MHTAQVICYVAAVIMLGVAAFGVVARVNFALLAAATALLGYALPLTVA